MASGDVRCSQRVVTLAAGWVRQPGVSIPGLSQGHAYARKAAYQWLGHAHATPDALQATHQQYMGRQTQVPGSYLLIENTTELS